MDALEVATTDGLRLSARIRGPANAPTVVLVHGYPDSSRVWDEVADLLQATLRVVTYDVRGAGASDTPASTSGYRLEQLADDLVTVADSVSSDAPVHVVGHDWGAIQAFEAVCSPDHACRIASFTCIGGASLDHAGHRLRAQLRPSLRPWRGARPVLEQVARSWYVFAFQVPALPERIIPSRLGRRILGALGGAPARTDHAADTFRDDAANGVGLYRANLHRVLGPRRDEVHVPTQVVVGDRDPFVSLGLFDDFSNRCQAGAWLCVVPGGHWLPRARPAVVADAITDLVTRVEQEPAPVEQERAPAEPEPARQR